MNTNSNSYTIIYASVMVIIVAFLLAFVSSSLKSTQDKNVQLDTKKQILAALNIKNVEDADAEYQKYVKGDMLMNVDGTLTENTGEFLMERNSVVIVSRMSRNGWIGAKITMLPFVSQTLENGRLLFLG